MIYDKKLLAIMNGTLAIDYQLKLVKVKFLDMCSDLNNILPVFEKRRWNCICSFELSTCLTD